MSATAPYFSVVVPCCNVEQYLHLTIQSVRQQSFQDFECLLVVEDSTDRTQEICQQAVDADSRFRLFLQPRSGSPAAPRNTGITNATGKWMVWLDGDDLLAPGALADLQHSIANATEEPDLVQCAADEVTMASADAQPIFYAHHFNYRPEDDRHMLTGVEATVYLSRRFVSPFPAAWLTVCRTEFLRREHLYFLYGLRYEDEEWTPRALFLARRVLIHAGTIYIYRRRPGSITSAADTAKGYSESDMAAFATIAKSLLAFHARQDFPQEASQAWSRWLLAFIFSRFFYPGTAARTPRKLRKKYLREMLGGSPSGHRNYRRLAAFATLPKRLATPLILAVDTPIFSTLLPVLAYFHLFYYPLMMRRLKQ